MWLNTLQLFTFTKNKIDKKAVELYLERVRNKIEFYWGKELEYTNYYMKENFFEEYGSEKVTNSQSDNLRDFYLIEDLHKVKNVILTSFTFKENEPELYFFLKKKYMFEINNFKHVIEINKGKNWLSNVLDKNDTLFLFSINDEVPDNFRYFYKKIGENLNSIFLGVVKGCTKKFEKNKEIQTKIMIENSLYERKGEELIIEFTTHLSDDEKEIIIPSNLFLEKSGKYWNIFSDQKETKQIIGINRDYLLKSFFKKWEVYESNEPEISYLRHKDKEKLYKFEPLRLYKAEYIIKLKEEWFLEKVKLDIGNERPITLSYFKYIEENKGLEKKNEKFIFLSYTKYLKKRNQEEKDINKLMRYSQTEYEYYKRHKIYEEKLNYNK